MIWLGNNENETNQLYLPEMQPNYSLILLKIHMPYSFYLDMDSRVHRVIMPLVLLMLQ